MTDAVQFHVSRARILLMGLVLGPLMTAGAALVLVAAVVPTAVPWLAPVSPVLWLLYVVVGVAGTVLFGSATVASLLLLRGPGPRLVVDAEGFTDTSSALASGRTTWDQVVGWHLQHVQRQTNLCVVVQDPEAVLGRMRPVARFVSRGNVRLVGTPLCIGLNNLGGAEVVLPVFEQHYEQWVRENAGTTES